MVAGLIGGVLSWERSKIANERIAMLFVALTTLAISFSTPDEWVDNRIDDVDREAMSTLVGYAPIEIGTSGTWIMPDEDAVAPTWSDLKGKVVIVQSWNNDSPEGRLVVRAASKTLTRVKDKDNIALVLVHTPEEHESAEKYCKRNRVNSPTVVDTTGSICNSLGFYKDPTNVLIDKQGRVRHVGLKVKSLTLAANGLLEETYDPELVVKTVPLPEGVEREEVPFPQFSTNVGSSKDIQGKAAPSFVVEDWVSTPVDVNGKVRIVEFWATWCPPCVASIPHMNDIAKEFKNDVVIVGVSSEQKQKVVDFQKNTKMDYHVAIDPQRRMQNLIGIKGIPHAIIVSDEGTVRWQGHPTGITSELVQQIVDANGGGGLPLNSIGRWKVKPEVDG